jgi:hypothetical protein
VTGYAGIDESEALGRRGGWRFTREHRVEPEMTLVFHELYERAFGPLRTRAIGRQVLTESEFAAQMVDETVTKYVAWDDDNHPVGMCAMTQRLENVPWISPEYFAERYPDHWERDAIWYFNFVLAHPSHRHARFIDQLIAVGIGELVEQRAICAYDICAYNDVTLGLGTRFAKSFERATGVVPRLADTQDYYTLDFS